MRPSATHPVVPFSALDLVTPLHRALSFLGKQGAVLGLAAVGIVIVAAQAAGVTPSGALVVAAFFLVIPSYGIDRLADAEADAASYPERAAFYRRQRHTLTVFYALCLLISVAAAASTGRVGPVLGVLAFPLSVVFYALPVLPARFRRRRAKDLPYAKGVYTSLCWAGLAPLAASFTAAPWSRSLGVVAAFTFAVQTLTCTVCDLKDIEGDRKAGVRTLGTALGVAGSLRVLKYVNLGTVIAMFAAASLGLAPVFLALVAAAHAMLTDHYLTRMERPGVDLRFYADVICDGVIATWPPIALLALSILR